MLPALTITALTAIIAWQWHEILRLHERIADLRTREDTRRKSESQQGVVEVDAGDRSELTVGRWLFWEQDWRQQ